MHSDCDVTSGAVVERKDVSLARRTMPVPEDIDTERLLLLTQGMEERRNHLSCAVHGPTGLLPLRNNDKNRCSTLDK